jgi:hypothetical protein
MDWDRVSLMLRKIPEIECQPIESNFGKGMRAAKKIINGAQPKTMADLEELMVEEAA